MRQSEADFTVAIAMSEHDEWLEKQRAAGLAPAPSPNAPPGAGTQAQTQQRNTFVPPRTTGMRQSEWDMAYAVALSEHMEKQERAAWEKHPTQSTSYQAFQWKQRWSQQTAQFGTGSEANANRDAGVHSRNTVSDFGGDPFGNNAFFDEYPTDDDIDAIIWKEPNTNEDWKMECVSWISMIEQQVNWCVERGDFWRVEILSNRSERLNWAMNGLPIPPRPSPPSVGDAFGTSMAAQTKKKLSGRSSSGRSSLKKGKRGSGKATSSVQFDDFPDTKVFSWDKSSPDTPMFGWASPLGGAPPDAWGQPDWIPPKEAKLDYDFWQAQNQQLTELWWLINQSIKTEKQLVSEKAVFGNADPKVQQREAALARDKRIISTWLDEMEVLFNAQTSGGMVLSTSNPMLRTTLGGLAGSTLAIGTLATFKGVEAQDQGWKLPTIPEGGEPAPSAHPSWAGGNSAQGQTGSQPGGASAAGGASARDRAPSVRDTFIAPDTSGMRPSAWDVAFAQALQDHGDKVDWMIARRLEENSNSAQGWTAGASGGAGASARDSVARDRAPSVRDTFIAPDTSGMRPSAWDVWFAQALQDHGDRVDWMNERRLQEAKMTEGSHSAAPVPTPLRWSEGGRSFKSMKSDDELAGAVNESGGEDGIAPGDSASQVMPLSISVKGGSMTVDPDGSGAASGTQTSAASELFSNIDWEKGNPYLSTDEKFSREQAILNPIILQAWRGMKKLFLKMRSERVGASATIHALNISDPTLAKDANYLRQLVSEGSDIILKQEDNIKWLFFQMSSWVIKTQMAWIDWAKWKAIQLVNERDVEIATLKGKLERETTAKNEWINDYNALSEDYKELGNRFDAKDAQLSDVRDRLFREKGIVSQLCTELRDSHEIYDTLTERLWDWRRTQKGAEAQLSDMHYILDATDALVDKNGRVVIEQKLKESENVIKEGWDEELLRMSEEKYARAERTGQSWGDGGDDELFETASISSREKMSKEKTFQERVAERIEARMTDTEQGLVKYSIWGRVDQINLVRNLPDVVLLASTNRPLPGINPDSRIVRESWETLVNQSFLTTLQKSRIGDCYRNLSILPRGLLYEDSSIQLYMAFEKTEVIFTVKNVSSETISDFSLELIGADSSINALSVFKNNALLSRNLDTRWASWIASGGANRGFVRTVMPISALEWRYKTEFLGYPGTWDQLWDCTVKIPLSKPTQVYEGVPVVKFWYSTGDNQRFDVAMRIPLPWVRFNSLPQRLQPHIFYRRWGLWEFAENECCFVGKWRSQFISKDWNGEDDGAGFLFFLKCCELGGALAAITTKNIDFADSSGAVVNVLSKSSGEANKASLYAPNPDCVLLTGVYPRWSNFPEILVKWELVKAERGGADSWMSEAWDTSPGYTATRYGNKNVAEIRKKTYNGRWHTSVRVTVRTSSYWVSRAYMGVLVDVLCEPIANKEEETVLFKPYERDAWMPSDPYAPPVYGWEAYSHNESVKRIWDQGPRLALSEGEGYYAWGGSNAVQTTKSLNDPSGAWAAWRWAQEAKLAGQEKGFKRSAGALHNVSSLTAVNLSDVYKQEVLARTLEGSILLNDNDRFIDGAWNWKLRDMLDTGSAAVSSSKTPNLDSILQAVSTYWGERGAQVAIGDRSGVIRGRERGSLQRGLDMSTVPDPEERELEARGEEMHGEYLKRAEEKKIDLLEKIKRRHQGYVVDTLLAKPNDVWQGSRIPKTTPAGSSLPVYDVGQMPLSTKSINNNPSVSHVKMDLAR